MDIRELSFQSRNPLGSVPARRDRLRIIGSATPIDTLYSLARFCKFRLNQWVTNDQSSLALISEDRGQAANLLACLRQFCETSSEPLEIEILKSEAIDLSEPRYQTWLFQLCNYRLCSIFKTINPHSAKKVQENRKRIYSNEPPIQIRDTQGRIIAEARRYLTFDFWQNSAGFLFLTLHFRNEYQSIGTIDQFNWQQFPPKQRLIHTYDGKSCQFLGVAPITIGQPLAELGNQSLLDYHRDRQNLAPELAAQLDPNQPAVAVGYAPRYQPFHHLPQLLKRIYAREDLPSKSLNHCILPLAKRQELMQRTIDLLNKRGFICGDQIEFDPNPWQPDRLTQLTAGSMARNLSFGADPQQPDRPILVDEAWRGWKQRALHQKPAEIRTQVLYPQAWEAEVKKYMVALKSRFQEFGITLTRAGDLRPYDPQNSLSLRQVCQNLPVNVNDLIFAFVPNGQDPIYNAQVNPYFTLKRILNQQSYCSQMVTRETMRQIKNDGRDQNVVFGILAKLGYAPWQLHQMPGTAQAFVGLDLGRKEERTIGASAFVVNRQGQAIGWSSASMQRGETFSEVSLRNILLDLFGAFTEQSGEPLRHVVIHRDGTIKNSELATLQALEAELQPHGLEQLEVVEVVKDVLARAAVRAIDPNTNQEQWQNPDRGWAWVHNDHEAIVLTTGAKQAKVAPNASPQPLLVRRRHGQTDILTIAAQIYWLSEMHIGSTQVIRLPITTYYADRIAEVALKDCLPADVRCERRLYFV